MLRYTPNKDADHFLVYRNRRLINDLYAVVKTVNEMHVDRSSCITAEALVDYALYVVNGLEYSSLVPIKQQVDQLIFSMTDLLVDDIGRNWLPSNPKRLPGHNVKADNKYRAVLATLLACVNELANALVLERRALDRGSLMLDSIESNRLIFGVIYDKTDIDRRTSSRRRANSKFAAELLRVDIDDVPF